LVGGYGPDVKFIVRALRQTFDRLPVDPRRLAVTGFSDGASYALSVGLTNGDLFTHVIAFSPGFASSAAYRVDPEKYGDVGVNDASATFRNRGIARFSCFWGGFLAKSEDGATTQPGL
jgi:phospholipase/carboxylesterase